ncbi:MAG TPA: FG-GAP repeat protein [Planctomycetota bacterium]|nr:FG-GAP repeat protein [Planctomycetota bacterium]
MLRALRLSVALAWLALGEVAAQGIPKQEAKLTPVGGPVGAFGTTVGVSGDTAVVGSYLGPVPLVFVRDGTSWTEQASLNSAEPVTLGYGVSVAISGDTAVVSDPGLGLSGVNWTGPGAVFVFVRQGTSWTKQAKIAEPDFASWSAFGTSIALSGDTLVVGAGAFPSDAAYVFVRNGAVWSQQAKLQGGVFLGQAVSISGDTILAGGPSDGVHVFVRNGTSWTAQTTLTTVPSVPNFGQAVAVSGNTAIIGSDHKAFVFFRSGAAWNEQAELDEPVPNQGFGRSVAVSDVDDAAVVGTPAATVGGHSSAGTAYVYLRSGSGWEQQGALEASDASDSGKLGFAVALSGDTAVAGTDNAGAAYVFHPIQPFNKLGGGLPGVSGVPLLNGTGTLDAGSAGSLTLANAAPFTLTMLFVSLTDTPTPFKGGTLSTVPIAFQLPVGTFFTGSWTLPWSAWPSGVPSGTLLYFQVGVSDAGAVKGVAISNLLKATQP